MKIQVIVCFHGRSESSPLQKGYSTSSVIVVKVVIGIKVEVIVVATEPRSSLAPLPFRAPLLQVSLCYLLLQLNFITIKAKSHYSRDKGTCSPCCLAARTKRE